ncbi:MAG: YbaL family putative K(+) efflux transporter [Beijerinckiaceae bacterium]|nr:YbaL family putative K(+) efflux transporter [Beijerinckiaceae bacterium]
MPHDTPLISTIVAGIGLAFVFGFLAQKLKLPTIAGYLLAGVVIGPFTPGYVADQKLANELAELGVILLMFGVGLHFSLKDLLAVRVVAVPGAIGQIASATLMGMALSWAMGWTLGAGIVFGLALSVASTVVLLKALQERRLVESERGRIAIGWLIVEDIVMVLTLVLLPPLASLLGGVSPTNPEDMRLVMSLGVGPIWGTLAVTAAKIIAFLTLMLVVGRKLVPWLLHHTAHSGSRELFRLSALAIALGIAFGASSLFGVSFALGAFFAGMVMAESPLSSQAARETLPLRDAFAVLFFVSVGMLFNPSVIAEHPVAVLAVFLIIVVGKSAVAYLIVRAFRYPRSVALTISASLAQIGEFSFILMVLGAQLKIIPDVARDLVVAGAILSILVNSFIFVGLDKWIRAHEPRPAEPLPSDEPMSAWPANREEAPTMLTDHFVLVGHGRVGARLRAALLERGLPFLVVEDDPSAVRELSALGVETFAGGGGEKALLDQINLKGARCLISAISDAFEAGSIIEQAKASNPQICVIARANSQEAVDYLRGLGAQDIVFSDEAISRRMIDDVLAVAARPAPQPQVAATPPAAPAGVQGG